MKPIKCWLILLGMALFIINTNETAFASEIGMTVSGVLPAAPSATQSQAETVLGIPWGATETEAKRIMQQRPNTAYWYTEKDARKTWQVYMGPFNDDRADIRVFFYQGKMFQVIIAHHLSEDNLFAKFNALKNGMVSRYGAPSREGGKYLDSEAFWDLGGGIRAGLKIRKSYLNKPEIPFVVQLAYWQRDIYLLVNPEEKGAAGPGKDF